ncbi:RNA polymerase sigma factor [Luteimonas salinilitoris]
MEAVGTLILKLRKLLHSRGRTRDETDEAIQEAFLRLQRYRQARHVQEPEAFLVRTVLNAIVDEGRRRSRWRSVPLSDVETLPLVEAGLTPEDVLTGQQRLRTLRTGLEQLNARTREVFLLHRIEGYSHAQIAARMGITVSAVEKHVAKAALFLTEWMDRA